MQLSYNRNNGYTITPVLTGLLEATKKWLNNEGIDLSKCNTKHCVMCSNNCWINLHFSYSQNHLLEINYIVFGGITQ
jgi:hypothetical protein